MLLAATLVLLLQAASVVHVVRAGRPWRWISIVVLLPVVGSAIYYASQVHPARKRDAARRKASALLNALGEHRSPGRMRLVFIDRSLAYTVRSAYDEPLGGAASAACYLTEALAAAGHEVVLLTHTRAAGVYRGVRCAAWEDATPETLRALRPDAVVMMLSARYGRALRELFGEDVRLILWAHHAHDQPAMQPLSDASERDVYDGIAMVSEWQKDNCIAAFKLDPARVRVIGNAVAPAFRNLFDGGEDIHAAKARPPVLAYTSPPYRGLKVLLDAFPRIRARVPGITLTVYSSMRLYQMAGAQDDTEYGDLYRRCGEIEGVEYVGSLPQPQLARALRGVTALTYTDTVPETYCIAALEAMAAGCRVVSSELGAMPQTTAGYARLVPIAGHADTYADEFVAATVAALEESLAGADAALLARQVAYVNTECAWTRRADEWIEWLASVPRTRDAATEALER